MNVAILQIEVIAQTTPQTARFNQSDLSYLKTIIVARDTAAFNRRKPGMSGKLDFLKDFLSALASRVDTTFLDNGIIVNVHT